MTRIIQGVEAFRDKVFSQKQELFAKLQDGQRPLALFITCADSRIDPNLLTQTEPGELFVHRNAGNLVPPFGAPTNGEAASIEYAVKHLQVRDIIVCGHSHCGAMQGAMNPEALSHLPNVSSWLTFAKPAIEKSKSDDPNHVISIDEVIQQNVLIQIENVKSYPVVTEAMSNRSLRLHAWVYYFERGNVKAFDASENRFVELPEASVKKLLVQ